MQLEIIYRFSNNNKNINNVLHVWDKKRIIIESIQNIRLTNANELLRQ